jgi:ubiquinone/menaquinone biosynthesis C-methylase UbiE
MHKDLLKELRCPYCTGEFNLTIDLKPDGDHVHYGSVECNCFEFPIVDGVLLLSLTQGYGGSEDKLFPYESFLAAVIAFIHTNNLAGLEAWIRQHSPILGQLMYDEDLSFADFNVEFTRQFNTHNVHYLDEQKRQYGVIGQAKGEGLPLDEKGESIYPQNFEDMLNQKMASGGNFYIKRYFDSSVSVTRNFLLNNKPNDYLLSLCFGQGVFENVAREHIAADKLISIDAQLINIFMTKRFIHPEGQYICHDLYFPLPFRDDFLSGVFASTCLPELVNQAQVVREIARVARPDGWGLIEHIWIGKMLRYVPSRYYRYMQNMFASFNHYLTLLNNTCDPSRTHVTGYGFNEYTLEAVSDFKPLSETTEIDDSKTGMISILMSYEPREIGRNAVALTDSEAARLRLSPMYELNRDGDMLNGTFKEDLRDFMNQTSPNSFEIDLTKLEDRAYLTKLYEDGVLLMLPERLIDLYPALPQLAEATSA